jgi:hypothetical protein
MQGPNTPFIAVNYAAKIVFTLQHDGQERADLRATWQQSQGLWKNHPVFHGMGISEVIAWLRGEDCDV